MTVVAVSMTRDEEDVIESTTRHMLTQVDHVIIADNMSDDGTRKILEEIAAECDRLTVVDDFEKGYYQGLKMTALARQAHVKFGADFVVPYDSDEFWFSPFGRIGDILTSFADQWLVVEAQLFDHMCTGVDNPDKVDPIERMRWRRRAENPLRKVACRWREDLVIAQGNHAAHYNGGTTIYGAELVIRHFPYRSADQMCNPQEAPIWMGDLSFKAIEDIEVGDQVMGAGRVPGLTKVLSVPSTVTAVHHRESPIVRVEFASGRWLRCTPDHLWRQHFFGSGEVVEGVKGRKRLDGKGFQDVRLFGGTSDGTYRPPKVGRSLSHVMTPTPAVRASDERLAGWLGGIFDGEGSSDGYQIQIGQSTTANPDVYEDICTALKYFGFEFTQKWDRVILTGGRQAYVDFFNITQPRRRTTTIRSKIDGSYRARDRWQGSFGSRYASPDRIVAVEPDGHGDVFGLTTTTGNYVAWGFASKNCRKVRNGAAAYKAGENIPADQGVHWREWGELLNREGEQAIHDLFKKWYYREDPTATLTVDGQVLPPLKCDPARQAAIAGA